MPDKIKDLERGVVLAELGGHGNGPYCAKHGAGAALVMMGTYIVDPGDAVPYPKDFVFKPDRPAYTDYLREHIGSARASGAKVGVSVATVKLEHTVDFLSAAEETGADYVSLCAHSTMEMFINEGLGEEMCLRQNSDILREWAAGIRKAVRVPVIFKIGLIGGKDTLNAVDIMADAGIDAVHINIWKTDKGADGFHFLDRISGKTRCLIAGGGIKSADDALRTLDAGADAVAVANAAMNDPSLCGEIQKALRSG